MTGHNHGDIKTTLNSRICKFYLSNIVMLVTGRHDFGNCSVNFPNLEDIPAARIMTFSESICISQIDNLVDPNSEIKPSICQDYGWRSTDHVDFRPPVNYGEESLSGCKP